MMASQVPGNRTDQNLMLEDMTLLASGGEHGGKMVTIAHNDPSALSSTKTAFMGVTVQKNVWIIVG